MNVALAVAAGGAAGSLARWWVVLKLKPVDGGFPWGTLAVNVIGSFAIGALWAYLMARPASPDWLRYGLMTGVLGGFTTLSAVSIETVVMLQSAQPLSAIVNVALNVGVGLGACALALSIFRPMFA